MLGRKTKQRARAACGARASASITRCSRALEQFGPPLVVSELWDAGGVREQPLAIRNLHDVSRTAARASTRAVSVLPVDGGWTLADAARRRSTRWRTDAWACAMPGRRVRRRRRQRYDADRNGLRSGEPKRDIYNALVAVPGNGAVVPTPPTGRSASRRRVRRRHAATPDS